MSRARQTTSHKTATWAALLALVIGCGNGGNTGGTGGDSEFDGPTGAGGNGGTGGSVVDAGGNGGGGGVVPNASGGFEGIVTNPVGLLVANPDRSGWDAFTVTDMASPTDYASTALACFDTSDACTQSECGLFAACCVDNGTCCKPNAVDPWPGAIDFASCADGDLAACLDDITPTAVAVFGPASPGITSRGLIPNGNASAEGGALVGATIDLAANRVQLDVEFTLPLACGASCLESAGVAFTATAPDAFVDAGLGLLLSGSRGEVNLMIGNAVVETFDAGTDSTQWTLIASPDGRVEVLRDGITQTVKTFAPESLRQASLALFGRNLSAASSRAAIRTLALTSAFCDVPSAWARRDPIAVSDAGGSLPGARFGAGPSIASGAGELRVAYALDGEIFWGRGLDIAVIELIDSLPALSPQQPYEALGVADPELVFDGDQWHLFYTARDATGRASIGHAIAGSTDLSFTADSTPMIAPEGDVRALDAPTVHMRDGLWVLIARAALESGETELRAYYTPALDDPWERIVDGELEGRTSVTTPGSEITGPSLIVHNSGYQLYYGRRAGTRWTIELLASDELLLWRPVGEALGALDDEMRFDALGGRAPDAISLTDRIEMVYQGHDGVSFELGWAVRQAPGDTAPTF